MHLWEELFARKLHGSLHVDSSACKGMILRTGAGRVKHLSTKQLWVQAAVETQGIAIHKISRSENFADMLTHCLPERESQSQLQQMHFTCHA